VIDLGNAVRQEFLGKIKLSSLNDVLIDIPSDSLGHLDALGITLFVDVKII
jgi:hypothetical protein